MAYQLKTNVPTCLPLHVAPLQILTGLSYCLLTERKATGYLHPRDGVGGAAVDNRGVRVCVMTSRGKGESRSESSPSNLPVNRWRAEERGKRRKEGEKKERKKIKQSCSCDGKCVLPYILSQCDRHKVGHVKCVFRSHKSS